MNLPSDKLQPPRGHPEQLYSGRGMTRCCSRRWEELPKWLQHWATPRRLLLLLCTTNLVFFLDRGVVASNGVNGSADDTNSDPGISATFGLSLFQDGLVAALYYVGVMLGAPLFAVLNKRYNALRLLGVGGAVFALGAVLCGFSQSFSMVLIFRCLVGSGTGSLIALGPPLIDDHAPVASKALWLGVFYLCMPTGVALGYLFGGAIGSGLTWRAAFWIESGLAVPSSLWCLWAPPVDIRRQGPSAELPLRTAVNRRQGLVGGEAAGGSSSGGSGGGSGSGATASNGSHTGEEAAASTPPRQQQLQEEGRGHQQQAGGVPSKQGVWKRLVLTGCAVKSDLGLLWRHPVAICVITALTFWNGFIGAYGYYGPKAVRDLFAIDPKDADFLFGAILAATGLFGSLAGGFLLDAVGSSMRAGMLIGAVSLVLACLAVVLGVTLAHSQAAFWPAFALGELLAFLVQAPANAACMWSVPAGLRPFALSISEVMQHLLGDIPMPPALGAMQGAVDNWRLSLAVFALLLLAGAVAFLAGAVLARHAIDYRSEEQPTVPGGVSLQGQEQQLLLLPTEAAASMVQDDEEKLVEIGEGERLEIEQARPSQSYEHN